MIRMKTRNQEGNVPADSVINLLKANCGQIICENMRTNTERTFNGDTAMDQQQKP